MKYEVHLLIQHWDNEGEVTNNSEIFTFTNENILEARRATIAKAKELEDICEVNPEYVSSVEAASQGYEDYSSYSLSIFFYSDDEDGYIIYGSDDDEEILENLSYEVTTLIDNGHDFDLDDLDEIEGEEDTYEVMVEDLEFFIN